MLDALKKKLEHYDKYAELTGVEIVEARRGYGKVRLPYAEKIMNSVGIPHGGALFTIADMAFAVAANYGQEEVMVSTNANISFIKGAKRGPLVAEGRFINGGRRLATYAVEILDGEGTIVAAAMISGYRLDAPVFPEKQD